MLLLYDANLEKMSTLNKSKSQRTTLEQLQYYVTFCKKHPELKGGKDCSLSASAIQNLWDQLSKVLNDMKGPTRTSSEWKVSLKNWKNTIQSRARKAKAVLRMSSDGPKKEHIHNFNEHAVKVLGNAAAAKGVQGGITFGFNKMQADKKDVQLTTDSGPSTLVLSPLPAVSVSSAPPSHFVEATLPLPSPPPSDIQPTPSSSRNPKEKRIEKLYEILAANNKAQQMREDRILDSNVALLEDQRIREERILSSNLAFQQSLEKVANSLATLTEVIAKNASKLPVFNETPVPMTTDIKREESPIEFDYGLHSPTHSNDSIKIEFSN